jgi:hypothetical protein
MAANITITTNLINIDVLFNDIGSTHMDGAIGSRFKREELIEMWHETLPVEHLKLVMDTGIEWRLALVGSGDILPVTSIQIDGGIVVTPLNIAQLKTELNKLFI